MAPRFSHGAVAAGLSSLDSVAGGGGADPTLTSTLGDIVDTTSPYSFAPTLTHTGTVLTTITRASDSSSVSVTGDTTTTPTATCTAADAALGDSFHCESVATLDGITKTVVTTVFMEGTGGAGGLAELEEIDLTDVETTVITTTGTHTVRNNADTADAFTVYVLDASSPSGWTLTFNGAADPPILLEGVQGTNSTGRAVWCCIVPSAWAAAPDWDEDRWFAQILFSGITCQGVVSGARLEIFAGGIQPAAAAAAAGAGGRTVSPWADGTDADWYDERWTSSTARTQQALTTTALPSSSMAILFDKLRDRLAVEDGASALSTDLTPAYAWTEDRVQSAADIAETDAAGVWTSGFGMFLYVYNRATAESSAAGIKQCKVYGVTL